ncbi:hypothetical protein KDW99_18960 [Marinomonas rhizomae]|uniref:hypothetical protein n=1 Tax=Marinomonas rhizomae TaxID=491948 RepID=UPI00210562A0|nr:hypothetical protein [Marinomonas rhizomae]UTV99297.1 hypothetical protein KDW99_18960 [Marinomonas rhizomae]
MRKKYLYSTALILLLSVSMFGFYLLKLAFSENYQTSLGSFSYYFMASDSVEQIVETLPQKPKLYKYTFGDNGPIREALMFDQVLMESDREAIEESLTMVGFNPDLVSSKLFVSEDGSVTAEVLDDEILVLSY